MLCESDLTAIGRPSSGCINSTVVSEIGQRGPFRVDRKDIRATTIKPPDERDLPIYAKRTWLRHSNRRLEQERGE